MLSAVLLTAISWAAEPEYEFRATWLTTVSNIDWPSSSNRGSSSTKIQAQKQELIALLDKLAANNINAVLFQVRGRSDAFYSSSYEPWAAELTGTLGTSPGYDPLAFAIEEAHKRGIELHAWFNPFRASTTSSSRLTSTKVNSLYKAPSGKTKLQWSWLLPYNNGEFSGQIIDPGYPEARQYLINVIMEVVTKYDIDGIVMDDYFYPYGGTTDEDAASFNKHYNASSLTDVNKDGLKRDDWRRSNIDAFVRDLHSELKRAKPWVRFGMGTGGVWTKQQAVYTAYGLTKPSTVDRAMDPYALLYCNTVEWIKNGWVDYVNPQVYWGTNATPDYDILCQWWASACEKLSDELANGQRVHFFPSLAAYKAVNYESGFGAGATEIKNQVGANRNYLSSGYTGSVFFSNGDFLKMASTVAGTHFQSTALVPPMAWMSSTQLSAPNVLYIDNGTMYWDHASETRFVVYVYPQSVSMQTAINNRSYIHQVVYGKSMDVSGVNLSTHKIAVRTYDRYGVLHAAREYATNITWELNGGTVSITTPATVPTQEQLWTSFKSAAGITELGTLAEITAAGAGKPHSDGNNQCACRIICTKLTNAILVSVFKKSEWTWLRDYIMTIQTALTVDGVSSDVTWRYAVAAFFLQSEHSAWPASANFATAGKPDAWGSAYLAVHGGSTTSGSLPTYVTSSYTLPTPTKAGATFVGWYDNPNGIGTPLTVLPAGYTGTVYAIWSDTPPPAGGPVTWVLNGGHVNMPIPVPTQEELWTSFKAADAALSGLGTLAEITAKGEGKPHNDATQPCACRIICAKLTAEVVTAIFSKTEWQWLKTYIMGVQTSLSEDMTEWRYAIAAFFLQSTHSTWPASADFSTAGKPEAWGSAYQATQAGEDIALPSYITTDYVLPTPKKDGYLFLGWYDNSAGTGKPLTVLPAGYSGSVYAIWGAIPSDIEEVRPALNMNAPMYDILGRRVDANYRGIVIQNNNKYLIR